MKINQKISEKVTEFHEYFMKLMVNLIFDANKELKDLHNRLDQVEVDNNAECCCIYKIQKNLSCIEIILGKSNQ
jgi:hypothetical protein